MLTQEVAVASPATAAAGEAEMVETAEQNEDDGGGPSFFEEEAECKALITRLGQLLPPAGAADVENSCLSARVCQLLPAVGQEPDGAAAVVDRLEKILDRYLESPYLLNPYLEGLVSPLVDLLLRYLPHATDVWAYEQSMAAAHRLAQEEKEDEEEAAAGQGDPSLLGRNYDMFDADAPKSPIHLVCRALYVIVKTAGEAACASHFPNDVRFYEDVFYALRLWKGAEADAVEPWARIRQREWEVRYCLLLWLCNLVLIPFSLRLIDSASSSAAPADLTSAGRITNADSLSDAVLVMAVQFLTDSSKCRDGAALLVARLLTRPDSRRHRDAFFGFAKALVDATVAAGGVATGSRATAAATPGGDGGGSTSEPDEGEESYRHLNFLTESLATDAAAHPEQRVLRQFQRALLVPGVLSAMSMTLKLGQRREMLPYAGGLIPGVAELVRLRASDALLCKTAVKVVHRLVLAMLRNTSAPWKYKRHDVASLEVNLGASGQTRLGHQEDNNDEDDADCGGNAVEGDGDALEEGIGLLLETLAHKDTIVRWSSAAGIGRVCDRLPADMVEEVVEAVYECFASEYDDAAWHGGLLALAELCRRSIIDATGLDKVVPIIAKGLGFDLSKGTYSVGAHVRDAACYVCWSIARAYDAGDIEKHVHRLSVSLVVTALFDREVNVRRAAAAAFQECVGRLGNFPDGIALVTTMDFFSLASRANAFLQVAPTVALHDAYRGAMLAELVATKLLHWDRDVRRCAAGALGKVAAIEVERSSGAGTDEATSTVAAVFEELQARVTDQTVSTRHGAILGLAELVRGGLPATFWTESQRERLADVVVRIDQARLFRSRGGEHIRHACCQLVSACASVHLPLPPFVSVTKMSGDKVRTRTLGKIQEFLEETWKNILEWLQLAAAKAFAEVAAAYYTTFQPAFHGKVMAKMLDATAATTGGGRSSITPLERRGFLAAMGGLPTALLVAPQPVVEGEAQEPGKGPEPYLVPILRHLCAAATDWGTEVAATAEPASDAPPQQQQQQQSGDAESRRNAVCSLARVLAAVPPGHASLTPELYHHLLGDTVLAALQDYAVDKRGDVGSFVRIAALQALPSIVAVGVQPGHHLIITQPRNGDLSRPLGVRVLQGCVKASLEKLDRVRGAAGAALVALLAVGGSGGNLCEAAVHADGSCTTDERDETVYLQTLVAQLEAERRVEWTSPRSVLSSLAAPLLLHTPRVYAPPAMEGLVVSAGDMSLHVQQPGMHALLSAFRANSGEAQERLSALVIQVGESYPHTERVLVPLSRVVDRLLNEGLFRESQHRRYVSLLRGELRHYATAITVVLPFVAVLATLCRSNDTDARNDAWLLALAMVASRYPKVRARMATDLYTALLVLTSAPEAAATHGPVLMAGCKRAMEHLLNVQWDANDAAKVRGARNELYSLLGLAPPQKADAAGMMGGETNLGSAAARPTRAAVASTYASLVQEAGY